MTDLNIIKDPQAENDLLGWVLGKDLGSNCPVMLAGTEWGRHALHLGKGLQWLARSKVLVTLSLIMG